MHAATVSSQFQKISLFLSEIPVLFCYSELQLNSNNKGVHRFRMKTDFNDGSLIWSLILMAFTRLQPSEQMLM